MIPVVVIGTGGHGREMMNVIEQSNKIIPHEERLIPLGFIDDCPKKKGTKVLGKEVLGNTNWLKDNKDLHYVIGIGNCKVKEKISKKLRLDNAVSVIHPSVIMGKDVSFGKGCVFFPGVILTTNIKIGNHVHFNLCVTISHDVVIDDFCTINPHASVNGICHLEQGVYVGAGAVLNQLKNVGMWSTLGSGSVVTRDIPSNTIVVGIPAKELKK